MSSSFQLPSAWECSLEIGKELYQLQKHWEELETSSEASQARSCPREMGCTEHCWTLGPCSQHGETQTEIFSTKALYKSSPSSQAAQILKKKIIKKQKQQENPNKATIWGKGSTRLFAELLVHRSCCAQCSGHLSISNPLTAIWVSAGVALAGLHFWFLIFSGCQNTSCQIQVNRLKTQMSTLDLSFPCRLDMLITAFEVEVLVLLPRPPFTAVSHLLPVTFTGPIFCEHHFSHRHLTQHWHTTYVVTIC